MRQLLPGPADDLDVDAALAAAALAPIAGRPTIALNMVASLDGATAVAGRSGDLAGAADREVLRAVRATADVILVAAGTVRSEAYGPVRVSEERRRLRLDRGQEALPRFAVVSGSLDLDDRSSFFADAEVKPVILTRSGADAAARARLAPVAELVELGPAPLRATSMVDALGRLGATHVVCEGGPSLNGQLAAADLIDRIHLTTSPMFVGGDSSRLATGCPELRHGFRLGSLWFDPTDDLLFARYDRDRSR